MAELNKSPENRELVLRYLSGQASDVEVRRLEEWVTEKTENRTFFNAEKKAWMLAAALKDTTKVDVDAAWKKTENELFGGAKIVQLDSGRSQQAGAENVKTESVGRRNWLGLAATLALLTAAGIWWFVGNKNGAVQYAAQEEMIEQVLSDGSTVALNKFSKLKYTGNHAGKYRQVELTGDAFFDVARDEAHPFIIQAEAVEIEVLGTSFYVDARAELSKVQIIVETGSVAVRAGTDSVTLAPGESAIYDETTRTLSKKNNTDTNFLAWTTNTLTFEESTLDEVVFALNRQYHAQITLANPALKECVLTARYVDKTLEAVLRILEKSLGVDITIGKEEIVIAGQCE